MASEAAASFSPDSGLIGAAEGAEPVALTVRFDGLASSLGLLMKLGQLAASERNTDYFRRAGLAPSAYTILRVLQLNPGLRQGQLAAALRIKPTLMTRLIRDFEERGWVARKTPDDDRRAVTLTLTPKGATRVADAEPLVADAFRAEQAGLSEAELAEFQRLLRKLCGMAADGTLRLPG